MTLTEDTAPSGTRKVSKLPLLIGVLMALLGGGGGFYVVYSGMLDRLRASEETAVTPVDALPDIGFVALDPLVVSLGPTSENRHLRFVAQLEAEKGHVADLQTLRPRIADVLNSYLRALETQDLEDPCVFRSIRPPIPTTCAQLFRGIRPPVTRCREAACFGYQS